MLARPPADVSFPTPVRPSAKAPLYRKVNTRALGVRHGAGGDYRHVRGTKAEAASDAARGSMHGGQRRGRDYTPLFRFLLSKVGEDWDAVLGEATARLDTPDPIYWLVARHAHERRAMVTVGESTHYSGLYVDDSNRLRRVDPALGPADLVPFCTCCTHTFNGVPFAKRPPRDAPARDAPARDVPARDAA